MRRPFAMLSVLLLAILAMAHALRIAMGWPLLIGNLSIPMWSSVAAVLLCALLAVGLTMETRTRSDTDIDAWRRRERDRPRGRDKQLEDARPPAPLRKPAEYFLFASDGISPKEIRNARARYERIMVGFDAGNITDAALRAAKAAGAELEIYVEGPGGPTGDHWSPDERKRIKAAAESVGIDTHQNNWMREWDRVGWKTFTFRQLEGFLHAGYSAGEIDNLDRVLGDGPDKTLAFYKEYAALHAASRLPRLVIKNLSETKLTHLVAAIEQRTLPRAMFSEFHISEKGSGNRPKQDALSSRIAIRTVPSDNTYHYDARGEYGLDEAFVAVMSRDENTAVATAGAPTVTT